MAENRIRMIGPSGEARDVHPDQVEWARQNGWVDLNPAASRDSLAVPSGQELNERQRRRMQAPPREALAAMGGAAGGTIGSLAGPVTAVYGAGLGGSLGAGLGAALEGAGGRSPKEIAGEIGLAGAGQSAAELAGMGLAAGARATARPFMRGALDMSKAVRKTFGGNRIVEKAIETRVRPGAEGLRRASSLADESTAELENLLAGAERRGKSYTAEDLTGEIQNLLDSVARKNRNRPETVAAYRRVEARLNEFLASRRPPRPRANRQAGLTVQFGPPPPPGKPFKLTPKAVNDLKREFQQEAFSAYKARERGPIGKKATIDARFDKRIASGARSRLAKDIPGYAAQNRETQALLGLQQALKDIEDARGGKPRISLHEPWTWMGKDAMGATSLGLTDPSTQLLLRQSPRALAQLLLQMQAPPDTTEVP